MRTAASSCSLRMQSNGIQSDSTVSAPKGWLLVVGARVERRGAAELVMRSGGDELILSPAEGGTSTALDGWEAALKRQIPVATGQALGTRRLGTMHGIRVTAEPVNTRARISARFSGRSRTSARYSGRVSARGPQVSEQGLKDKLQKLKSFRGLQVTCSTTRLEPLWAPTRVSLRHVRWQAAAGGASWVDFGLDLAGMSLVTPMEFEPCYSSSHAYG